MIQGWMGPGVRVLMHPVCDHNLYFIQCVKDFRVQPFLSTRPIEAFVAGVLPGTAWMDTDRLAMDFSQSFVQYTGRALNFRYHSVYT